MGGSNLPLRWYADVMHGLYHGFGVFLVSDIRYGTRVQIKLASRSWRPIRRACPPFMRFVDGTGLVVDMQDTYYPSSNLHTFFKYISFFLPL